MLPPLSTSEMRAEFSAYLCNPSKFETVAIPGDGRDWYLSVASPTVEAWEVFAVTMLDHGVLFLETAGGTYSCRQIAGSNSYSLHAYAVALDINPSKNPHQSPLQTNFPDDFIEAVEGIGTVSGRQVFQWGGRWSTPDAMHFQIGATIDELATGIEEEEMALSEADKDFIKDVVRDEIDSMFRRDDDETSRLSRAVWQHGGSFSTSGDDKDDNAQKTLVRVDKNTGS